MHMYDYVIIPLTFLHYWSLQGISHWRPMLLLNLGFAVNISMLGAAKAAGREANTVKKHSTVCSYVVTTAKKKLQRKSS